MKPTLNVIHLPSRADRYEHLVEQMQQQGIKYKLWDGEIIPRSRKTGVCKSHKKIVRWAKENNQPFVIIAEDDVRFFAPGAWDYYLSKIPESYDIYFSMIYRGLINDNGRIYTQCSGMTLYTVHKRFYDTFLSIPDDTHVDRHITALYQDYEFIVCNPFICEQSGSYSDNSMRKCDYRPLLRGRQLFG